MAAQRGLFRGFDKLKKSKSAVANKAAADFIGIVRGMYSAIFIAHKNYNI